MTSPTDDRTRPARAGNAGKTNLLALRDEREHAIELISERFSEDVIDADEMERRLELVHAATRLEEIAEVTDDLRGPRDAHRPESTALVPAGPSALTAALAADAVPAESRSIAVFGDTKREGPWTPARQITAFNVFGDTTFDFRDARLGPGEVTLRVRSLFGDVKLIVPPGLAVEVDCPAILASVKRYGTGAPSPPAGGETPRVRITGFVALSDLRIEERLPGESRRDARRRYKELRNQRKQLDRQRKQLPRARRRRRRTT